MKKLLKYKFEILAILLLSLLVVFFFLKYKATAPVGEVDNKIFENFENINSFGNDIFKLSKVENGFLTPINGLINSGQNNFRYVFGRDDEDIQSKQIYIFSQPENISIELQGVDAQSSNLVFRDGSDEIFTVVQYDHTNVNTFRADPLNFSQTGGHTIMILPGESADHPAVKMFRETLTIGFKKAFNLE